MIRTTCRVVRSRMAGRRNVGRVIALLVVIDVILFRGIRVLGMQGSLIPLESLLGSEDLSVNIGYGSPDQCTDRGP
jgi:hypothetical protein